MNTRKLIWIELIKAFALVWIFINHTSEQLFGFPMFANPISGWPPLSERIAQLSLLSGYGLWDIPVNLLRYIGWTGDQGVQLFIIASGFGLTWSLLHRQADHPLALGSFYLKRAERIFPLWWGAHILFIITWLLTGWGLSLFDPNTYLSFLGIRITPGLLYYFSPAWWYIWLIIQLYLIYPLLWETLRRIGPLKLLVWSSVIAFALRGVGLYLFDGYLDAWARGAIFITRLPEFVFGISLAAWMYSEAELTTKRLQTPLFLGLTITGYIAGMVLSFTLPGMIIAPFLLGVSAFVFLYLLFDKMVPFIPPKILSPGIWMGEHSYSLYLVHNPVILALVSSGLAFSVQGVGRILLAVILTIVLAIMLEWVVNVVMGFFRRIGLRKSIVVAFLAGFAVIVVLIGSELLVRRVAPQEVLGWGERSSLEPDPNFGWRLIPSTKTRLRWSSYDYVVQANSLGFPGPEYSEQKYENTYRIMVVGDAFSSAEGVDTPNAWPRLLEGELAKLVSDKNIEVLNFAITGYGPKQYASVVSHFAPIYMPDLIIIETFVNDFQDAVWNNEDIQWSIGFGLANQDSIYSILRLEHLRRWVQINIYERLNETFRNQPNSEGYFLGNFSALERGQIDIRSEASAMVYQNLQNIASTAKQVGAEPVIFMVPASVQVCKSDDLPYYPRDVNLSDTSRYDIDMPQRVMAEIATSLNIPFYDLREPLITSNVCPYQPRNMHWILEGHELVSQYIAKVLLRGNYIP
jgi:peptidoglycan/LPS O-acetylase OafA/YrhL